MKKILAALVFALFISIASASVTEASFDEVPSAWQVGEDLQFSMTSEGSNIDQVLFQSRQQGEQVFTDRRTKTCSNYGGCDWSFEHSESNSRTFEYRFRIQSGDGGENTRYQEVTYYHNLDYGVSWTNKPPQTASSGSRVSMSVTAEDSAERFDDEGTAHLQYLGDDGDWHSFDTRDCSNSYTSGRCSNSGSTYLDAEKLDERTASFRGLVKFKGGVTARTSVSRTSLPGNEGAVDDVRIYDLPEEVEEGESFDIEIEAEGENLDRIYIQEKEPGESVWTDWRSTDCDGGRDCVLVRNYDVVGTGGKEFRAYAEAGDDSDSSDSEYVDFIRSEDETPESDSVDSVNLDELGDRRDVDEDLQVTGDASGNNLDEIVLQTKKRFESWDDVESENCGNDDECGFDYEFNPERTGNLEFRLVAYAGDSSESSNIESVEFYDRVDYRVDDVDIDNLPSTHPTNEDLDIMGDADGKNLERIILQKRDPGEDWERVETDSCSGSKCDFGYDYSQNHDEEVDFRLRAEAGDDYDISGIETVDFQEDTIDAVTIQDLPYSHPTDEDLEIVGEAEGEDLEVLTIQEKDADEDDWNEWRSTDCDGANSCEIGREFNEDEEVEKDFRIKAETNEHTDYSAKETVEFVEDEDRVENVDINDLPEEYSTGRSLEIVGEAEGENLDTITIQERDYEDDSWDSYREKECNNQDNCQINRDYITDTEEEKSFRIRAEAGGDVEYSNIENVEFIDNEGQVDSVSINNLPASVQKGDSFDIEADASGENLQRIYIQEKNYEEDDWNSWRSEDCGNQDSCDIERTYSAASTGEKYFRAYVESTGDSGSSTIENVEFTSRISYSVQNVVLYEIPDRGNIADPLQVSGKAEGENLNEVVLQTKRRFGSWTQQTSKSCSSSSTCNFDTSFEPESTENLEFRLVAYAGGESEYSNIEVVNFFRTEEFRVDSVNIVSLPDSYPVDESLQIIGDAEGENLEEIMIQRRKSGSWQNVETSTCSGNSCQITDYYIEDEEGTVDFRIRAEAGNSNMETSLETVDFQDQEDEEPQPEDRVNSVSIENLPADKPVGESLNIEGEASGNNLDEITVQERGDGGWQQIKLVECGDSSTCSISTTYTATETTEKDFRVKARAGDDTRYSDTETVGFYIRNRISSIAIDELGSENRLNTPLTVSGSMEGENLDKIEIQEKRRFSSWNYVDSNNCEGSICTITTQYTTDQTGNVEFRIKGTAGGRTKISGIEVVEFRQSDINDLIDSIEISSPEEARVDQEITVSAELEGNADDLAVERKSGGSWEEIYSRECPSQSCEVETVYSTDESGTETFRAKAYSDGQSITSATTETVFYPENGISDVSIVDLPDQYPVDDRLEIKGSAVGIDLENLIVQSRKHQTWEDEETVACSEIKCSIETSFISNEELEYDFRIKAVSQEGEAESSVETVEFIDEISSGESEVSSVVLDGLQDEYPVRREIEISASARGKNLDNLRLQEKRRFESWDTFEQVSCFGSRCEIEEDYEAERTGLTEFRAIAEAGDESKESNIEVVDFRASSRQDQRGDDAYLEVRVRDEESRNLENTRVRVENGDTEVKYTDDDGEVDFELEPDEYEVRASKDGYRTEERDVELEEDETELLNFRLERIGDFDFSLSYSDEVCIGEDLTVEVEITNFEDDEEFEVSGTGLGAETDEELIEIDEDETEEVEVVFRDVEELDDGEFTVRVENGGIQFREGSVEVQDCTDRAERDRNIPTGLSAQVNPTEVLTGETVRITGDVQNVNRPVDVTVSTQGFGKTVSTTSSGGYTVFYTPSSSGMKEFTVSAGGFSTKRQLEVLPRARISRLDAPAKAVEGEDFEICADVSSDTEPEVILFRDGERLDSRAGSGRVCFEVTAGLSGGKRFWVRAATSGETGSASKNVEVIEAGEEFDTFPGQVTVRNTEPGQARMTVYNQGNEVRNYEVAVSDIPDSWVSITDDNVVLAPGERKTVYFYFSPQEAGEFTPEITASADGEEFAREIRISSTDTRQERDEGLLSKLI